MNLNRMNRIELSFNDRIFAKSFVFDFYDNILELNIGNHDMKIDSGREITLWGYDLSGNRATAHAIVQNFKEGKAIVEITSDFVDLPDRRRALKLAAVPPIPASLIVQGNSYDTEIKDISVTGIFIAYEGALVTGHKCNIFVPSLHVDTEIRIVRRQDDNSGYGCEFVKLKPKEEDEILQYLFKRQLEEREIMKRRKENSE